MIKVIAISLILVSVQGCMVLEKGVRATASLGLEGYSEHVDTITVTPDEDPVICRAWRIAGICKPLTALASNGGNK